MKLHYCPETDSLYIELSKMPGAESREVVEGTARPLYIYADRSDRAVESSASA